MLDLLANGEIDKIVYIRVPDDRAQSIGFYPGTLEEKTALYWEPLWQALEELGINRDMAQVMESQGFLETKLDVTLRGTNLSRAGVIVDEIENFRGDTLKLVFTRFHDDVHAVALGDGKQRDQKHATDIFRKYCDFLADSNMGNKCELTKNYRGRFSSLAESFDLDG